METAVKRAVPVSASNLVQSLVQLLQLILGLNLLSWAGLKNLTNTVQERDASEDVSTGDRSSSTLDSSIQLDRIHEPVTQQMWIGSPRSNFGQLGHVHHYHRMLDIEAEGTSTTDGTDGTDATFGTDGTDITEETEVEGIAPVAKCKDSATGLSQDEVIQDLLPPFPVCVESPSPSTPANTEQPSNRIAIGSPIRGTNDDTVHQGLHSSSAFLQEPTGNFGSLPTSEVIVASRHYVMTKLKIVSAVSDVIFSDKETKIHNSFVRALDAKRDELFGHFTRSLPTVVTSLVSVRVRDDIWHSTQDRNRTYICIAGFTRRKDIKAFDQVMSQPDKRKLYTPLEICYQLRRISRTSSSGHYAIKSSQDLTYCGTLMVSQEGQGSPRISTVGGLIQILDWTYALTTSHPPDPSEDGSDDEDEADFDKVFGEMSDGSVLSSADDELLDDDPPNVNAVAQSDGSIPPSSEGNLGGPVDRDTIKQSDIDRSTLPILEENPDDSVDGRTTTQGESSTLTRLEESPAAPPAGTDSHDEPRVPSTESLPCATDEGSSHQPQLQQPNRTEPDRGSSQGVPEDDRISWKPPLSRATSDQHLPRLSQSQQATEKAPEPSTTQRDLNDGQENTVTWDLVPSPPTVKHEKADKLFERHYSRTVSSRDSGYGSSSRPSRSYREDPPSNRIRYSKSHRIPTFGIHEEDNGSTPLSALPLVPPWYSVTIPSFSKEQRGNKIHPLENGWVRSSFVRRPQKRDETSSHPASREQLSFSNSSFYPTVKALHEIREGISEDRDNKEFWGIVHSTKSRGISAYMCAAPHDPLPPVPPAFSIELFDRCQSKDCKKQWHQSFFTTSIPRGQDVEIVGEWQLCLIRPGSRRPNLILDGSDLSLDSQAVQSYSSPSRMSNSSPREVLVISGRSGLKRGSLSRTPSAMLLGKQGPQEVWTIGLWHDLQAGDSGSWVISKDRHSLLGVVVARSTGCAYMVSFSQIQKDLGAHWNLPPDAVKLPRDFSWVETMYDIMVAVFNTAKPYVDRIRDPFRIFRRTTRGGEVEGLSVKDLGERDNVTGTGMRESQARPHKRERKGGNQG